MIARFVLVLLLVAAPPASAVRLGNGVGQVLIYPYYTVRAAPGGSAFNSLLTIVNRSQSAKAVRLRVREALAGAAVLEATIFLSTKDVWTGAIVATADGAGLVTRDRSCTLPQVIAGTGGAPAALGVFTNANYASDPLGAAQERVREGYVEVIEMGAVKNLTPLWAAISHTAGVPTCALGNDAAIVGGLDPPSGDLYGSMTLVDVAGGSAFCYDAVALEEFSKTVMYSDLLSAPTLADANPAVSNVVDGGRLFISRWATGLDAVNAVLSAGSAEAEYMREKGVAGATDIVYTMPTKPLAVDATRALQPFFEKLGVNGACEISTDSVYDREERVVVASSYFAVGIAGVGFCYAATVQSVTTLWPDPSGVVGSATGPRSQPGPSSLASLPPANFESGVAAQSFRGTNVLAASATLIVDLGTGNQSQAANVQYFGLPVVGVSFVRYVNGSVNVGGVPTLSNYGAGGAVRTKPDIRP